jgi:alpha-glucosidase
MELENKGWYPGSVIYQIYPRSYKDSNGDGIGDLLGIVEKLDYIKDLGVSAIWLSPIYKSPMLDLGYDISDYTAIDPIFGSLNDFDLLVEGIHKRKLKIMLDFVPNHTSSDHQWFLDSRSSKDNPKRDWYIWKDPKPDGSPPNNWISVAGGTAWEFDEHTGQYYLHSFLKDQPDLNWRNPEVVDAMSDVLRFWLNRGVDGFRVDVFYYLLKDERFLDEPINKDYKPGVDHPNEKLKHIYSKDQPETREIMAHFNDILDEFGNKFMVSETYVDISQTIDIYNTSKSGSHAPFNFHLIFQPFEVKAYKKVIDEFQKSIREHDIPVYVLGNHDQSRIVSRLGGMMQARLAAMMKLTLPGTPFIYYGDEIGMEDTPIPHDKHVDTFEVNRDPQRTPMQWDTSLNAGFSKSEPWLPVNPRYKQINVVSQRESLQSTLTLYKTLIRMRKTITTIHTGQYVPVEIESEYIFAYLRTHGNEHLLIVLNFSPNEEIIKLPYKEIKFVISTYLDERDPEINDYTFRLRPHEGWILRVK